MVEVVKVEPDDKIRRRKIPDDKPFKRRRIGHGYIVYKCVLMSQSDTGNTVSFGNAGGNRLEIGNGKVIAAGIESAHILKVLPQI